MGFLILAGDPHSYRGASEGFQMDALGFGGEASLAVLKALRLYESGVFRFSDPVIFSSHIHAIWQIQGQQEGRRAGDASKEIYSFLLDISRSIRTVHEIHAGQSGYSFQFIPEMISYMEEHCELALTLDDMAERFDRSKEYICTVFKKETGMTYVDFLTRARIFRARNLLLEHPEMKLADMAERCGFSSASYVGAVFKKDVGVSPGTFRLMERQ